MDRVKNRDFIITLLIACIFLGIIGLMAKSEISGNIPGYVTHIGHSGEEQFIYSLTNDYIIEQEFVSPKDFDFATINFSDHEKQISGKTFISVLDKTSNDIIYYKEVENSEIHYGDSVCISIENGGKKKNPYILRLQFEGMGEEGLGIFGFKTDEYDMPAIINGETGDYSVGVGTHTYTSCYKILTAAVFLMIFFIIIISLLLVSQSRLSEEYLFLGIIVPVGITFLLFLSVNVVHDGGTHLAKVYHYSNVLLGWDDKDTSSYVYLKTDEAKAFDEIYVNYRRDNEVAQHFWDTIDEFDNRAADNQLVMSHEYRGTSASSLFEYFPGVIGLTLGRLFGGSARFNILFAKIFFFVFYAAMAFYAIKISPYLKSALAFTVLLPMGIYQATGITYDSVVMAVCIVIIALFFRAREGMLSKGNCLILLIFSVILGCVKGGFYLLFLLPFMCISARNYGSSKRKWFISLGSIAVGTLAMLLTSFNAYWSMLQKMLGVSNGITTSIVDTAPVIAEAIEKIPETDVPAYGISYLFTDLFGFIELFIRTLVHKADFYLGGLLGYRMAWTDETIDWVILIPFILLLAAAAVRVKGEKAPVIGMKEKSACFFFFGVEVIAFHLLMLIETPVNATVINGVQGRYFIVWIPIVLYLMYNERRVCEYSEVRKLYYYFSIAECLYIYCFFKIFLGIS